MVGSQVASVWPSIFFAIQVSDLQLKREKELFGHEAIGLANNPFLKEEPVDI